MRTTVTLDDDVLASLQQLARERSVTFKEVLNSTLRAGLRPPHEDGARPYRVPVRPLHVRPDLDLDRALRLASDLEDDEVVRELGLRR